MRDDLISGSLLKIDTKKERFVSSHQDCSGLLRIALLAQSLWLIMGSAGVNPALTRIRQLDQVIDGTDVVDLTAPLMEHHGQLWL